MPALLIENKPLVSRIRDLARDHKQIVRAVFLEFAYREQPPIQAGQRYLEAPWWLVDGAIQVFRRRDQGLDTELFRRLVETNKLPPIEQFITAKKVPLGATAETIDSACALGLVQLLLDQPSGRANLSRLVRHWPDIGGDPLAALKKEFPGLKASSTSLQKWWTLNLARFAAADRYHGLTIEDTDRKSVV